MLLYLLLYFDPFICITLLSCFILMGYCATFNLNFVANFEKFFAIITFWQFWNMKYKNICQQTKIMFYELHDFSFYSPEKKVLSHFTMPDIRGFLLLSFVDQSFLFWSIEKHLLLTSILCNIIVVVFLYCATGFYCDA